MSQYHAPPHSNALASGLSLQTPALFAQLRVALVVARTRRGLSKMDDNALADFGLTADQAAVEASRSFWNIASQCKN